MSNEQVDGFDWGAFESKPAVPTEPVKDEKSLDIEEVAKEFATVKEVAAPHQKVTKETFDQENELPRNEVDVAKAKLEGRVNKNADIHFARELQAASWLYHWDKSEIGILNDVVGDKTGRFINKKLGTTKRKQLKNKKLGKEPLANKKGWLMETKIQKPQGDPINNYTITLSDEAFHWYDLFRGKAGLARFPYFWNEKNRVQKCHANNTFSHDYLVQKITLEALKPSNGTGSKIDAYYPESLYIKQQVKDEESAPKVELTEGQKNEVESQTLHHNRKYPDVVWKTKPIKERDGRLTPSELVAVEVERTPKVGEELKEFVGKLVRSLRKDKKESFFLSGLSDKYARFQVHVADIGIANEYSRAITAGPGVQYIEKYQRHPKTGKWTEPVYKDVPKWLKELVVVISNETIQVQTSAQMRSQIDAAYSKMKSTKSYRDLKEKGWTDEQIAQAYERPDIEDVLEKELKAKFGQPKPKSNNKESA